MVIEPPAVLKPKKPMPPPRPPLVNVAVLPETVLFSITNVTAPWVLMPPACCAVLLLMVVRRTVTVPADQNSAPPNPAAWFESKVQSEIVRLPPESDATAPPSKAVLLFENVQAVIVSEPVDTMFIEPPSSSDLLPLIN